jgi:hypothetical protein
MQIKNISFRSRPSLALATAAIAAVLSVSGSAGATPIDSLFQWSIYAYVRSHHEGNTGDVAITFSDSAGNQVTHFPNPQGTNICASPSLIISKNHPLFERLSKAFLTAGLSRRLVWFGYESIGSTCYLKTVSTIM